jgi:sulfide:quinone oxidoreductase
MPFPVPIPPSPESSRALLAAFAERGIAFVPNQVVRALGPARRVAVLDDGRELPFDLFLGVPKHRVPDVVSASGLTENGWIPVDPKTLETHVPGVYAIGDVANVGGMPKAGVFAESAARVVAAALLARFQGGERPAPYAGTGSCFIEFGAGRVGRVDVDFLSGPRPRAAFVEPSTGLVADKHRFGSARRARWFGM